MSADFTVVMALIIFVCLAIVKGLGMHARR